MAARKKAKGKYTIKVPAKFGWPAATIHRTTKAAALKAARSAAKKAGIACVWKGKRQVKCFYASAW
jgi:hypothetical protein